MASFADLLDESDVEKVRAYVIHRANEDRAAAAAAAAGAPPAGLAPPAGMEMVFFEPAWIAV